MDKLRNDRRIRTRDDLKFFLALDRASYELTNQTLREKLQEEFHLGHTMLGYWFLKKNRKLEYWANNRYRSPFHHLIYEIKALRYMFLERRYGVIVPVNVIGPGARFWHFGQGTIIINGRASIGMGFSASANCIVGHANDEVPEIGNFVEMSVDSKILGGVTIPDDVVVGAGALVIKTVESEGSVMGGVPAKVLPHHVLDEHERRKRAVLIELAKW